MQKILMGAALVGALAWNLAQAGELSAINVSADAEGTRAELTLDAHTEYRLIKLSGPHRLVVDLDATSVRNGLTMTPAGWVTNVRTGLQDDGTRVVFDLKGTAAKVRSRTETVNGVRKLVLTFPGQGAAVASEPTPMASVAAATPAPVVASSAAGGNVQPIVTEPTQRDRELNALISDLRGGAPSTALASANAGVNSAAPAPFQAATNATAAPVEKIMPRATMPTTVATGVPTRRATGVPTALTSTGAAALKSNPVTPPRAAASSSSGSAMPPVRTATRTPVPAVQSVRELRNERLERGQRKLVIAIDAGHGGQDPGARGQNGTREKDVTLQIARELARQVNATPGMRAVLIRDSDYFIPLPERPRKARKAGADIFVSIHADAAENRSADGSSVYVLSTRGASSQRARWLADKENASDLIGGVRLEQASSTLTSVLFDLTQSGHMRASEDAASNVLEGLKRVGNIHKHSIERANFAVLRGSDMPSMLVETAFISNVEEEQRLRDPAFQSRIAGAVLDGVHTYFSRQPPPGTIYASLEADGSNVSGGSP